MKSLGFIKNVSIIIIYVLLAKFLSFLIELLFAVKFGANDQTDAFFMAYGIIQVLYPIISIGIWKVFMPEYKTRIALGQHDEALSITNKLLFIFLLIVVLISVLIILYPTLLIRVFAPGFNSVKMAECSIMLRILSIIFFFNTIATFCSVILQANGCFGQSQLKEVVQHIPPVVFLFFFAYQYGINGVSFSIVFGAILSATVAYYYTKKFYKICFPKTKLFDKETIKILKYVPIACLNAIINQINGIVDRAFSSILGVGTLTYLNYGSRLIHFFDSIFSSAISTVLFPHITELVAKHEEEKLNILIRDSIMIISAFFIPISFFILIYPYELVGAVFGYGNFNISDVASTSTVLMMYAIGLPAMGVTTVINDFFYVKKRASELMVTTIICVVINAILDFILIGNLGVAGLALATSISYYLALFMKLIMLKKDVKIDGILIKNIFLVIVLSFVAVLGCQLLGRYISVHKIIKLVVMLIIFGIIYIITLLSVSNYYRNRVISIFK